MTSHPKDMSDDLIAAMALGRGICKHIHLPVQSGSDAILRAMNRGYSGAQYLERVRALRSAIPGVGITSDIIVGFPGETDSDFEDTLTLAEEARFDAAYTFIYSPRKGTRAAQLPGRVDPDISAARIQKLIETQERQTRRALESLVGTRQTVLADEISRRDKTQVSGKCDRAISVSLPGDAQYIGKFIDVVITSIGHNTLRGEAIDRNE
jgi:tRNA-2-methylthio-N6-dimethylallyladenosine synthase